MSEHVSFRRRLCGVKPQCGIDPRNITPTGPTTHTPLSPIWHYTARCVRRHTRHMCYYILFTEATINNRIGTIQYTVHCAKTTQFFSYRLLVCNKYRKVKHLFIGFSRQVISTGIYAWIRYRKIGCGHGHWPRIASFLMTLNDRQGHLPVASFSSAF